MGWMKGWRIDPEPVEICEPPEVVRAWVVLRLLGGMNIRSEEERESYSDWMPRPERPPDSETDLDRSRRP